MVHGCVKLSLLLLAQSAKNAKISNKSCTLVRAFVQHLALVEQCLRNLCSESFLISQPQKSILIIHSLRMRVIFRAWRVLAIPSSLLLNLTARVERLLPFSSYSGTSHLTTDHVRADRSSLCFDGVSCPTLLWKYPIVAHSSIALRLNWFWSCIWSYVQGIFEGTSWGLWRV